MLSDEEKRELREMAASESLRNDFRALRRNSQALERRITVEELAYWLSRMARLCPQRCKARPMVHYIDVKI